MEEIVVAHENFTKENLMTFSFKFNIDSLHL